MTKLPKTCNICNDLLTDKNSSPLSRSMQICQYCNNRVIEQYGKKSSKHAFHFGFLAGVIIGAVFYAMWTHLL